MLRPLQQRFDHASANLRSFMRARLDEAAGRLLKASGRFGRGMLAAVLIERGSLLRVKTDSLKSAAIRALDGRWRELAILRLASASLVRLQSDKRRDWARLRNRLDGVSSRAVGESRSRLEAAGKLLSALSHQNVLDRGFALVRAVDGVLIRRAAHAVPGAAVALVFADGERGATIDNDSPSARATRDSGTKSAAKPASQKSLFD
jgi:exodeoxyribonuclease VII large subunit